MIVHIFIFTMAEFNVISLNCHGFNIGTCRYLRSVAHSADIILLQETWLCDATSSKLNDAFGENYIVHHSSAMVGRPSGGTAILVHKKLGNYTYRIATDNPRLTAVRCQLKSDSDIIIGSVYMPFNDNSVRHYDDFLSVIVVMQGLVNKFYSCNFIFGGDFNTSKLSATRTHDLLNNFCGKIICCGWILSSKVSTIPIIKITLAVTP